MYIWLIHCFQLPLQIHFYREKKYIVVIPLTWNCSLQEQSELITVFTKFKSSFKHRQEGFLSTDTQAVGYQCEQEEKT